MSKRSLLMPVFLTVFLDMLGIGIIIPVLPSLFLSADTGFLPLGTPEAQKNILYGYLIAIYPFMQFFGAPVLGALSDRFGRKPMLSISLAGTMIGYLLFGYSILTHNLWLLFVSRALPGFTGGNVAIVYSAISDITHDDLANRPKYFGLVGMAFGLGFIMGPAIGGILADSNIVSWFNHATPFWFTAMLTFINLILLWRIFPETLKSSKHTELNFGAGFKNLRKAFSSPNLRGVFVVSLLISLGFAFFTQFFSVFLIHEFGIAVKDIGLVFAWMGIWLVLTQGYIVRKLSGTYASAKLLRISILLLGIAITLVLLPGHISGIYWVLPLVAIFQGITSPNMTTVVSSHASPQEQGEILGINQSMISVGNMLPPVIAGYLTNIDGSLPIITGGIVISIAWLIFVSLKK